jgi:hypothetical protein
MAKESSTPRTETLLRVLDEAEEQESFLVLYSWGRDACGHDFPVLLAWCANDADSIAYARGNDETGALHIVSLNKLQVREFADRTRTVIATNSRSRYSSHASWQDVWFIWAGTPDVTRQICVINPGFAIEEAVYDDFSARLCEISADNKALARAVGLFLNALNYKEELKKQHEVDAAK